MIFSWLVTLNLGQPLRLRLMYEWFLPVRCIPETRGQWQRTVVGLVSSSQSNLSDLGWSDMIWSSSRVYAWLIVYLTDQTRDEINKQKVTKRTDIWYDLTEHTPVNSKSCRERFWCWYSFCLYPMYCIFWLPRNTTHMIMVYTAMRSMRLSAGNNTDPVIVNTW